MPLVVPGVARFALNQTLEGRPVVNVLDYFIDTTGSTMGRAEAIDNQAQDIIEQWATHVLDDQVDDLTFDSVSYVDLDSATGITGSRTSSATKTLPIAGTGTGAPIPANTAALVTKQAPSARGRRNGRLFLAGLSETMTEAANGNRIEPANLSTLNSSFSTFLSNTNNLDSVGTAFSSNLAVVHITARDAAGNPTSGVHSVVESLIVDGLLATQRRRLRK